MTLATRNNVLLVGVALTVAMLGLSTYVIAVLVGHGYRPPADAMQRVQHWLLFRWDSPQTALGWNFLGIGTLCLTAPVAAIFYRRYFLKTSAPEVFFFAIFVLTLAFDGLKSVQLYFLYLNLPTLYGIVITRFIYFGQFLGSFALLASSLYAAGVQYQKFGTALGIAALISFALAYIVPVDALRLSSNLLYDVGNESTIQTILLLIGILAVLSYLTTVVAEQTRDHVIITASVALAEVGRGLLFYTASPMAILAGALALVGGVALYGIRKYRLYLWM